MGFFARQLQPFFASYPLFFSFPLSVFPSRQPLLLDHQDVCVFACGLGFLLNSLIDDLVMNITATFFPQIVSPGFPSPSETSLFCMTC